MKWVRFYVSKKKCKGDYRPISWPIKYPYWCSGENSRSFILVGYVDSEEELKALWPEAEIDDIKEVAKVVFTSRFQKPDWYKEEEE